MEYGRMLEYRPHLGGSINKEGLTMMSREQGSLLFREEAVALLREEGSRAGAEEL